MRSFVWKLTVATLALCSDLVAGDLRYRDNSELNASLHDLVKSYPNVAALYNIGKSVTGVDLTVIRLAGPQVPIGTPHVKLIGNIHGNEPLGRELLLRLAEHLLVEYERENQEIVRILDSTYVHILPSMNPDGFEIAQEGACEIGPGRRNVDNIDLNTNFPSAHHSDDVKDEIQPETRAIMEWMHKVPFVLSAAIHGGSVVAKYPYDAPVNKDSSSYVHRTEDHELFKAIATNYSETHGHMASMNECPGEPEVFERGIVNGAVWHPMKGSMQDYNYDFHSCLELTLLLSCCKYPGSHELERYWVENKHALLNFVKLSQLGVKGVIRNGTEPIAKAAVTVYGRKSSQLTTEQGEYWKLLYPGHYHLQVEKDGFKTAMKRLAVPDWPMDSPVVVNVNLGEPAAEESGLALANADDSMGPELVEDGWAFVDPQVALEYDEAWQAKVDEHKKSGYDDDEANYNSAHTLRLNRCTNILPFVVVSFALTYIVC